MNHFYPWRIWLRGYSSQWTKGSWGFDSRSRAPYLSCRFNPQPLLWMGRWPINVSNFNVSPPSLHSKKFNGKNIFLGWEFFKKIKKNHFYLFLKYLLNSCYMPDMHRLLALITFPMAVWVWALKMRKQTQGRKWFTQSHIVRRLRGYDLSSGQKSASELLA